MRWFTRRCRNWNDTDDATIEIYDTADLYPPLGDQKDKRPEVVRKCWWRYSK